MFIRRQKWTSVVILEVLLCSAYMFVVETDGYCETQPLGLEELRQILIGRCEEYQRVLHPEFNCTFGERNCTTLWGDFSSALDNPWCDVPDNAFEAFIAAANHSVYKQMFWSGVNGFVQRYTDKGQRYMALEDTLTGYMVNSVAFCEKQPGADNSTYGQCPKERQPCNHSASTVFWKAVSNAFAELSRGHIYAMFNASREPIIGPSSFFRTSELTHFKAGVVTKLTVFLVNSSPSVRPDPCFKDPSIQELFHTLAARHIDVECIENPRDAVFLFCMDHPLSEICQTSEVPGVTSMGHTKNVHVIHSFITFCIFTLLLS